MIHNVLYLTKKTRSSGNTNSLSSFSLFQGLIPSHLKNKTRLRHLVAQSVKCPILDFSSGHDLRVVRWSPMSGFTLGLDSAWDSLSLLLHLSLLPFFLYLKK